jgi:phosphoglycerol transferase MdoB-like AlkP superfamily enzyme
MQGPVGILQQKIDGGMEFLAHLPVEPGEVVAGKFVYVALAAIPGGFATALVLVVPTDGASAVHGRATAGMFLALWAATSLAAILFTGAALRFEGRHLSNVFFAAMAAMFALEELGPKLSPHLLPILAATARPWFPWVAGIVLTALAAVLVWLAWYLGCTGYERFTPRRDQIA